MSKYHKLSHSVYKCDYHIVWIPKYSHKVLKNKITSLLNRDTYGLSSVKEVQIEELNIQNDHVHLLCSILPKLSVSSYMGFLIGKTATKVLKSYPRLKVKPYLGNHF